MATLRSKEKAARRPLSYWSATPTGRETHLCVDLSRQSGEVWDCKKKQKKQKSLDGVQDTEDHYYKGWERVHGKYQDCR